MNMPESEIPKEKSPIIDYDLIREIVRDEITKAFPISIPAVNSYESSVKWETHKSF